MNNETESGQILQVRLSEGLGLAGAAVKFKIMPECQVRRGSVPRHSFCIYTV
jgi:hypothetical protein